MKKHVEANDYLMAKVSVRAVEELDAGVRAGEFPSTRDP